VSFYDENGDLYATRTWRRHCTPLWVEEPAWVALLGLQDLTKMLADACGTVVPAPEVDIPLF